MLYSQKYPNESFSIAGQLLLVVIYLLQTFLSVISKMLVITLTNTLSVMIPWVIVGTTCLIKFLLLLVYAIVRRKKFTRDYKMWAIFICQNTASPVPFGLFESSNSPSTLWCLRFEELLFVWTIGFVEFIHYCIIFIVLGTDKTAPFLHFYGLKVWHYWLVGNGLQLLRNLQTKSM